MYFDKKKKRKKSLIVFKYKNIDYIKLHQKSESTHAYVTIIYPKRHLSLFFSYKVLLTSTNCSVLHSNTAMYQKNQIHI